MQHVFDQARQVYDDMLEVGIAKECAETSFHWLVLLGCT